MTAPQRTAASRYKPVRLLGAWVAMLLLAACGRGIDTTEAVRQGVLDYLTTRSNLNVSAMNVEVTTVSFRKDEADATVSFTAKGAAGKGMSMRYTLERKGSKWVVMEKTESGGNPHGADAGANPHGGDAPERPLPPGHPATGSAAPPK